MWSTVLVNGDDMLFKCKKSFYPVFLKTASDAGFKISLGKNYLSPKSCMINSQVFTRKGREMVRCGYLNLKLVKGTNVKEGESSATPTQIGVSLNDMINNCPWTACVIPETFSRWGTDWLGKIYRPNWYMPVHLGGFGVDVKYAPSTWRITKGQREMAARFVSDPRMALYRRKGMNIPTAKLAGALARWRMIPGDYVRREGESDATDDPWLERLAYASRAHQGSKGVSDETFISRFKPQYRLDPMSFEGLMLYWNAQVFAFNLPPCPPMSVIRY